MTLRAKSKWLWLVIMPIFFVVASASAQGLAVFSAGQTGALDVNEVPGNQYFWEIFTDQALKRVASPSEAEFRQGNKGAKVLVEWKKEGDYYFCVTASGPTGCTNKRIGMIKVTGLAAISGNDTIVGACQSVKLDASKSTGKITAYHWSLLDPYGQLSKPDAMVTQFSVSPSYKGAFPANFRVKLLITDDLGNTDSDTVTVSVDPCPKAVVHLPEKKERNGSIFVDGSESTGTGISYLWSTNEGKIIGDNRKPIVELSGAGVYSLKVTDLYGCVSSISFTFPLDTHFLAANPDYARTGWSREVRIPVLENDYDPRMDIDKSSLRIKQNPELGDATVNPDGTITYNSRIFKPGNDQFIYEVCDSAGMCDSAIVKIDIVNADLRIPEGFSPNDDGLNDKLIFTGLENYPVSKLYVYNSVGQIVFKSEDYKNDWDGRLTGRKAAEKELVQIGTYYYILKLGGTSRTIKGFIYIDY